MFFLMTKTQTPETRAIQSYLRMRFFLHCERKTNDFNLYSSENTPIYTKLNWNRLHLEKEELYRRMLMDVLF